MRFSFQLLFAVALLSACALAQVSNSASPSSPPAAPSAPVLPPIDLKPDAAGIVPPEQFRQLLRRAEEKDLENQKQLRDYTFIEREEDHKLDGRGGVKKTESRTSEVLEIYGEQVERLTAKDDKPLSPDEAKKEDDKIQKIIDKRKRRIGRRPPQAP